jgi:hypothetical protein
MGAKHKTAAPAMPITQVMIKPCDLLPGISMLAMMPITGSFVSEVTYAAVGHAG